ncbi:MAG TPA: neutral/alkaline non-lysosomal ceramidase N-terminal domain-containing protein, partial [Pirellulaceae bacterium]|nr:neutral/alkaline non-lysosomal ceramidase N-terminal domain-containing protein [Pirellulaceae bacterium]
MIRPLALALVFALVHLSRIAPSAGQEPDWKAGLARVKITPEQPVFMAGYASRNKPYESIHDDLFAKVLVLEDAAGDKAVLVTADLIGFPAEIAGPIRARIAEATGILASRVLINASHTHTGPALSLDPTPGEGRALADSERTAAYTRHVQDQIAIAATKAAAALVPARLAWGVGVVHFVMNRREFTERGVILGVNPRGLADRGVPVLRIDGADGKPLAVVFGAACHNTTLGPQNYEISGDFAGHSQRLVEEKHAGCQAMFVQGCAGDANPYPRGSHELAGQHGEELAAEVCRVLETKLTPVKGPLRVAAGEVALPLAPPPSREELEKEAAAKSGTRAWVAQQMLQRLDRSEKLPSEYVCPLAVWQFGGDLTLVAL